MTHIADFPVSDDFFYAVFQGYFWSPIEFFFGFGDVKPDFGYVTLPGDTGGCNDGSVLQVKDC